MSILSNTTSTYIPNATYEIEGSLLYVTNGNCISSTIPTIASLEACFQEYQNSNHITLEERMDNIEGKLDEILTTLQAGNPRLLPDTPL